MKKKQSCDAWSFVLKTEGVHIQLMLSDRVCREKEFW